jgi:hypothetical protein
MCVGEDGALAARATGGLGARGIVAILEDVAGLAV